MAALRYEDLFTQPERPTLTVVPQQPQGEPDADHARRYALATNQTENVVDALLPIIEAHTAAAAKE